MRIAVHMKRQRSVTPPPLTRQPPHFLEILIVDVRELIRREYCSVNDRFRLRRVCRALYDEDTRTRRLCVEVIPRSWRWALLATPSPATVFMVALSTHDQHARWRHLFWWLVEHGALETWPLELIGRGRTMARHVSDIDGEGDQPGVYDFVEIVWPGAVLRTRYHGRTARHNLYRITRTPGAPRAARIITAAELRALAAREGGDTRAVCVLG